MRILKVLGLITLVVLLNSSGCKKQEASQVAPQSDFCYEGVLLPGGFCTYGRAAVQVLNAKIGEKWFVDNTLRGDNVITIGNFGNYFTQTDSVFVNKKIYFTLNLNSQNCGIYYPFPAILAPTALPSKEFCASYISEKKLALLMKTKNLL